MYKIILIPLYLFYIEATLVQPFVSTKTIAHTGLRTAEVSGFTYNICHDPTDRRCVIRRTFARKLREITRYENYLIETEIHWFETGLVRCENTVHMLNNQILADKLHISSEHLHSQNDYNYTRIYLTMARLVYLSKHLHSKMRPIIEECCLSFPVHIFDRLTHRLLKKWFILQDKCDGLIAHDECVVTAEITFDWPVRCEDARDVIYLLLKYAQGVLKTSFPVIDFAIAESE